jgi:hypothetical protein
MAHYDAGWWGHPRHQQSLADRVTTLNNLCHSVPLKLIRKSNAFVHIVSPWFQNYQAKRLQI